MKHGLTFNSMSTPKSKVYLKLLPICCILTVCLVLLFGCADPSTQKKSEETDATATKRSKSACLWIPCA